MDFETVDKEMIVDEAKDEERRVAKEVAFVLVDIKAEVEVEIAAIRGGEATNEGVDGQTVVASIDHPPKQA